MRKVCVVVGSRANYASVKSVMRAIKRHPQLELIVVASASALLDRFGSVVNVIQKDGFRINAEVNLIVEGETPLTMAKSTGLGLLELPTVFSRLKPDVVLTVGDRFETMATAIAAVYMNLPLAHTMGGEVSGTIDESIRHAITKLAHVHFPANADAAKRIIRMGENPKTVFAVGCPRIDLAKEVRRQKNDSEVQKWIHQEGVGSSINIHKPFLIVSQHPVTTEYGLGEKQINETLQALALLAIPTVMLWPNADAGSEDVSRGMRKFRERHRDRSVRFYKNFPPEIYLQLMQKTVCMIGNSSAAIREGAFLGTPAINVGSRQMRRMRASNVLDVPYRSQAIVSAVKRQLKHGRFSSSLVYGNGNAGEKIANLLAKTSFVIQKRIHY